MRKHVCREQPWCIAPETTCWIAATPTGSPGPLALDGDTLAVQSGDQIDAEITRTRAPGRRSSLVQARSADVLARISYGHPVIRAPIEELVRCRLDDAPDTASIEEFDQIGGRRLWQQHGKARSRNEAAVIEDLTKLGYQPPARYAASCTHR